MEQLDLTQTLKDCPKGTKLYSPVYGEVLFDGITNDYNYPIRVRTNIDVAMFTKEGKHLRLYEDGECMLYPSKEQLDWSKFKIKKKDLPYHTYIMASDDGYDWELLRYWANGGTLPARKDLPPKGTGLLNRPTPLGQWRYIIPFDKFDPKNTNECIKHFNYGTKNDNDNNDQAMKPTKKLSPKTKAVICTVLTVLLTISGIAEHEILDSNYVFLCIAGLLILLVVVVLISLIYLAFITFFEE